MWFYRATKKKPLGEPCGHSAYQYRSSSIPSRSASFLRHSSFRCLSAHRFSASDALFSRRFVSASICTIAALIPERTCLRRASCQALSSSKLVTRHSLTFSHSTSSSGLGAYEPPILPPPLVKRYLSCPV